MIEETPYAVVVGPHIGPDGNEVWALACEHRTVSTVEVEQQFSPNFALGLFLVLAIQNPEVTAEELSWIETRLLLGWTLAELAGCRCGERPFALIEDEHGVRVQDLP
jgi:hypothetical protein